MPVWVFPGGVVWHEGEEELRRIYHHPLDDYDIVAAITSGRLTERQIQVWVLLDFRQFSLPVMEQLSPRLILELIEAMRCTVLTDKQARKFHEIPYRVWCRYTEADVARFLEISRQAVNKHVKAILERLGDDFLKGEEGVMTLDTERRVEMIDEIMEVYAGRGDKELAEEYLDSLRETLCGEPDDLLEEEYRDWVEENEAWQSIKRARLEKERV